MSVIACVPLPTLQFLQSEHKMSLIKVAWYVLRVKNMHSWSPPDPGVHEVRKNRAIHIMLLGQASQPMYITLLG